MIVENQHGQRLLNGVVLDGVATEGGLILEVLTHARNAHYQVLLTPEDIRELRAICERSPDVRFRE